MLSLRLGLRFPFGKRHKTNEKKLLLIRPSMLTWCVFGGFVISGFLAAAFLVDSIWLQVPVAVAPIVVGLCLMGDFQDWVLDRHEGKAVVTKYSLLDWVCGRVRSMRRFPLDDVAAVRTTDDFHLELLLSSGESAASVAIPTSRRRELEKLRYSVSTFLCLEDTLVLFRPTPPAPFSRWPHFIKRQRST